jgi:hypothetical protein
MWEETAEWLPHLLSAHFDPNANEKLKQRQLIHHVTFGGGMNPETKEYDIWHGMEDNYFVWLDGEEGTDAEGLPRRLEEWNEGIRERWVEERRRRRFGLEG